jgi:hypothetical protein
MVGHLFEGHRPEEAVPEHLGVPVVAWQRGRDGGLRKGARIPAIQCHHLSPPGTGVLAHSFPSVGGPTPASSADIVACILSKGMYFFGRGDAGQGNCLRGKGLGPGAWLGFGYAY